MMSSFSSVSLSTGGLRRWAFARYLGQQDFGQVERAPARGLEDLLAATEAVREEDGLGRGLADGRQEDPLGAGHGDFVVPLFEAESARHAAASFQETGVGSEEAPVGFQSHDRVVMAV